VAPRDEEELPNESPNQYVIITQEDSSNGDANPAHFLNPDLAALFKQERERKSQEADEEEGRKTLNHILNRRRQHMESHNAPRAITENQTPLQ